jgi:hypothetical protein
MGIIMMTMSLHLVRLLPEKYIIYLGSGPESSKELLIPLLLYL